MKPFSQASERNKEPILEHLRREFADTSSVLEIGSGTGQHAVYFGAHLPHLVWIPSDLEAHHAGIHAWLDEAGLDNVRPPLTLDVDTPVWPRLTVDAVFTANTLHIISWDQVGRLLTGVAGLLPARGVFCIYGPFNYGGRHTSPSNEQFDAYLKSTSPVSGIRDFEAVTQRAAESGLTLAGDHAMPANNRLLVFYAEGCP